MPRTMAARQPRSSAGDASDDNHRPWYCDKCDGVITVPAEGQAIWRHGVGERSHDFRIVHVGRGCDDRSFQSSMHLERFIGVDGLAYLKRIIDGQE